MNPLLEQLHDIEGLDPISGWPLAFGWWVVIGLGLTLVIVTVYLVIRWIIFQRSWKSDTLQKLAMLDSQLSDTTARETLMTLSEYIRRIALRRYSRKECAGLTGDDWLKWLKKNDPKQFDWENHGSILIDAPYAPISVRASINDIKNLIQAVRNWVC